MTSRLEGEEESLERMKGEGDALFDGEGRRTSCFNAYLYLIQAIYMNMKANTATSLRDSMQIQLPKSKEEQLWETGPSI